MTKKSATRKASTTRAAANAVKGRLTTKTKPDETPEGLHIFDPAQSLSSGCDLLNVAVSGRIEGCYPKGRMVLLVGDSASGKTWLAMAALAEAANNPKYDAYDLVLNDVEGGAMMDFERYFGRKLARRIKVISTPTIEEFYSDARRRTKSGKPFILILDSSDALDSKEAEKTFDKQEGQREAGQQQTGSYSDGKAKQHSQKLRTIVSGLKATGSILVVISQTRDNIGFGAKFNPKTRAGGKALRFYNSCEIWTSKVESIKRTVLGKPRVIGSMVEAKVRKNRLTGRDVSVRFPIYYSHGIDDIGASVAFLIDEGHWSERKEGKRIVIDAPEFECEGVSEEKLVQTIDQMGARKDLRDLVEKVWGDIIEAMKVERRPRYD